MRRAAALAVALGGALAAPGARANPWDLYGFNARAVGMAGAQVAFADDFTAVHYNPAALTAARDKSFGFGFLASRPRLSLDFGGRTPAVAPAEPGPSDGVTFGALFPLAAGPLRNRVALGLGLNVPTRSLLAGQALDPAVPQWAMYQSLPSRIVAALGLGVSPLERLSLGLSVQLLAGLEGRLDYELDAVAGRFVRKTVLFDIAPRVAPIVGVEYRPVDGLRLGAAYRASISTPVALPVALEVTGIADLDVATAFQVQYNPHQVSAGAAWTLAPLALALSLDVTWYRWSLAPDPSVDSRLDVSGELFEGTGLADALDAPAPGQERAVNLGWRDVVVPRLGLEKGLGPVALRAGYALRPSPAPLQTSGANHVDGTAHQVALGVGVRVMDPLGALTSPLLLDAGASVLVLPPRRHEKIDPADPVGTFVASGAVWVAAVSVRYAFGEAPSEGPGPPPLALPAPGAVGSP